AQSKPLVAASSGVAQAKINSGPVIQEAYNALTLNFDDPARNKGLAAPMIAQVVPDVLKLLSLRAAMYATTAPPNPEADSRGPFFLTNPTVWATLAPPQRDQVMQQLYDLLNVAAQRVDLLQ